MKIFKYKSLEPSYLKVFRVSYAIVILLILIPLIITLSVIFDVSWLYRIPLFLVMALLFYGLFYWYSIHWYQSYKYKLNEAGLKIHKGVFWQQQNMVPRNRVQHIDITTGPLERRYDLSKLVIHTAGTRNSTITLPGLLYQDAADLRQELVNSDQAEDTV